MIIAQPWGLTTKPVSSIAALKAMTSHADNEQVSVAGYYAPGDGGGGTFYYDSGSSSTDDGGTVIAPDVGGGRWKRIYSGPVNVRWFGAKGDGSTNDNDAFRLASAFITSIGGGSLLVPAGTYIVGKQDLAGGTGHGYAYSAHDVIRFTDCSTPVSVIGDGAVLKNASGIKFGSFNPTTGAAAGTSTDSDNRADAPIHIRFKGCSAGVSVYGITSDGNSANLTKGGAWGDSGYQVYGYGLLIEESNGNVRVEGVTSTQHPVDGIVVWDRGSTSFEGSTTRGCVRDSVFTYNGRQGCSIVGGTGWVFDGCDFNHTGKGGVTDNTPGSGVDIEPLSSLYCRDIKFHRCRFLNNKNTGLTSPSGSATRTRDVKVADSLFWSSVGPALWIMAPYMSVINSEIRGAGIGSTYSAASNMDPSRAKIRDCLFTGEQYPGVSPSGVYVDAPINITGIGTLFERCTFDNSDGNMIYLIYNYNAVECEYKDCSYINSLQTMADGSAIGHVRGATFTGTNKFRDVSVGSSKYFLQLGTSIPEQLQGPFILDGYNTRWQNATTGPTGDVSRFRRKTAGEVLLGNTSLVSASIRVGTAGGTEGVWDRGSILVNNAASGGSTSYWQCTTAGAIGSAWAGTTAYSIGAVRSNDSGKYYRCTSAGTSASSGGPTGTGSSITDGGCKWEYVTSTTAVLTAHTL